MRPPFSALISVRLSKVEHVLLLEILLRRMGVIFIGHTAVHGADGSALRLLVETHALGAFVSHNVIYIHFLRFLSSICIGREPTITREGTLYGGAIGKTPFGTTFIDGVVGAFGFARTTVDALVSYLDGHGRSGLMVRKFGRKDSFTDESRTASGCLCSIGETPRCCRSWRQCRLG